MNFILVKSLSIVILIATLSALAADESKADGEALHNENCITCHSNMTDGNGSLIYTRADHKVMSFSALEAQVRRCESNIGLSWFDEEVFAVRDFLNSQYYKHDKPAAQ